MSYSSGYESRAFVAELYDLVPRYAERGDLGFYLELCRSSRGRILELGCGTGRILIPAARDGCNVVGVDVSEHMLAKCEEKLGTEPKEVQERVRLVRGNMTTFDLGSLFACAIIPFRAFQHLTAMAEQLQCLRRIHEHLEPEGTLVFDVFHPDFRRMLVLSGGEEVEETSEMELSDGRKLRRTYRIPGLHRAEQCMDVEMIYYLTDTAGVTERLVHPFLFRYFSRFEIEHLLARCGFRLYELYGDFDESPLTDESPEMVFVAEKGRETVAPGVGQVTGL
jgi:SAM-dependent methyltransferase